MLVWMFSKIPKAGETCKPGQDQKEISPHILLSLNKKKIAWTVDLDQQ